METQTRPLHTIVHTEFASEDTAATQAFMSNVFGWEFDKVEGPEPYAFVSTANGTQIGGIRAVNAQEPGPNVTNYVLVEDIELMAEVITQHGGTIVVPIQTVPNMGKMLWFQMPGGCVLACWQDLN